MSYIVAFVVGLVVSMIDSSNAVSCYVCNYTQTTLTLHTSCGLPLTPTVNKQCSAAVCSWQFDTYPSGSGSVGIFFGCQSESDNTTGDLCARYRNQYPVFSYEGSCCYLSTQIDSSGASYVMTSCFCQTDFCNADTSNPSAVPPPPTGVTAPPFKPSPKPNSSSTIPLSKTFILATIVLSMFATVLNIG